MFCVGEQVGKSCAAEAGTTVSPAATAMTGSLAMSETTTWTAELGSTAASAARVTTPSCAARCVTRKRLRTGKGSETGPSWVGFASFPPAD